MKRILHLSDLHFGRSRPDLLGPLIDTINGLSPDIVAISGDFTQRARIWQFQEAAAFLAQLRPKVIAVPGNHDTPLDNVVVRLLDPWGRYRRHIDPELEPTHVDDDLAIVGVNTVNRFSWQRGRIGQHRLRRLCDAFGNGPDGRVHVAMLHHPLEHLPEVDKRLMHGADEAIAALGDCGTHIVLSGHLHNARAAPFIAAPGVLFVQAGTGLSTRMRGESNNFNMLHVSHDRVEIDRYAAEHRPAFAVTEQDVFTRDGAAGWVRGRSG